MKKLLSVVLIFLLLLLPGCSSHDSDSTDESSLASSSEESGSAEDALVYIKQAAQEHLPLADGVTRTYVAGVGRRSFLSGDIRCYVFNIVDDYGSYREIVATYAASADGSNLLTYDIVTDEFVPLTDA